MDIVHRHTHTHTQTRRDLLRTRVQKSPHTNTQLYRNKHHFCFPCAMLLGALALPSLCVHCVLSISRRTFSCLKRWTRARTRDFFFAFGMCHEETHTHTHLGHTWTVQFNEPERQRERESREKRRAEFISLALACLFAAWHGVFVVPGGVVLISAVFATASRRQYEMFTILLSILYLSQHTYMYREFIPHVCEWVYTIVHLFFHSRFVILLVLRRRSSSVMRSIERHQKQITKRASVRRSLRSNGIPYAHRAPKTYAHGYNIFVRSDDVRELFSLLLWLVLHRICTNWSPPYCPMRVRFAIIARTAPTHTNTNWVTTYKQPNVQSWIRATTLVLLYCYTNAFAFRNRTCDAMMSNANAPNFTRSTHVHRHSTWISHQHIKYARSACIACVSLIWCTCNVHYTHRSCVRVTWFRVSFCYGGVARFCCWCCFVVALLWLSHVHAAARSYTL